MTNDEFSRQLKQRIYNWNVQLVKYIRKLYKNDDRSYWSILDQLMRSATSVGANYIEAIGSSSTKEFRKFLSYSLKSSNESKFWLALMKDSGIDNSNDNKKHLTEIIEISNILGKSVSTMYKTK